MLYSPLEQFTVLPTISIQFFSYHLDLTNLILYLILIIVFTILIASTISNLTGHNNYWSILIETILSSIHKTVKEQSNNEYFFPIILTLFSIILVGNLIANVPYNYAITSSLIFCITLSCLVFFGVTFYAIYLHKLKFLSYFLPEGTPLALVPILVLIEIVSYFCRAISLGVRAFANSVAGHTLINILSGFLLNFFKSGIIISFLSLLPFLLFLSLIGLEIAISFIQSYVFIVLTSSYIRDAIELH